MLALNKVQLEIGEGEVLALVGENGAGKSTLIKILTGALGGWSGEILWKGNPLTFISRGRRSRLVFLPIYQELTLCPTYRCRKTYSWGVNPGKKWID